MEPAMELRHYYEVLRKRVSIIAVIVALAVGGVVLQIGMRPAKYQAEVTMLVTPQTLGNASSGFDDTSGVQNGFRETVMNNIMYLMRSRTLLQRAGERLGMSPGALASQVVVRDVHGTDVLSVTAKDGDPERAALIANTITQEFTDYYSQINRTEATSTRKFIEDQLSRTKERLAQGESELVAFKTRTGAIGLSEQVSRLVGRTLDMQASYDTAILDEKTSRAKMDAIQSRLRSQNDQLAQLSVATNPVFAKFRDNLTTAEIELATMRQTYTDQHPKVQAQLGKIAEAKRQMSAEAAKIVGNQSLGVSPIRESLIHDLVNSQVDAEAARARTTGMSQILVKMQANLDTLPANELQLARLQRDVKVHEDTYLRLSAMYEDSLIKERKAGSAGQAAVIVVDPATIPATPESKRLPVQATFAALLGLIVGSAVALLVDSLDDSVRSAHEAEGVYGVPVLAAIPTMDPRSYKHLSGAPAISTVSLPVVLAILLGVGAAALSLTLVHQGAVSDHTAFLSRLFEVFQTAR
jgi:polysaccharide biosynthesis transport protein